MIKDNFQKVVLRNYKKIKAFQRANQLVIKIYQATDNYPRSEQFGIISQIRRAAVSIAANIVEGSSRQHARDYLRFLYISNASLAEARYLTELSFELKYLDFSSFSDLMAQFDEVSKTLFGLIKAVNLEV